MMNITNEEALGYLYIQRLGPCNMWNVACVQIHAIRVGNLSELVQAISLHAAKRYYYIVEHYEEVVEPVAHLLGAFIEERNLPPL